MEPTLRAPHALRSRASEFSEQSALALDPGPTPAELPGSAVAPERGLPDPVNPGGGRIAALPDPLAAPDAPRPAPRAPVPEAEPRAARLVAGAMQLGAFALLTYLCLFNFSVVRGSSMTPRIHDGDRILIDHWSYLLAPVRRGDIVVLKYPLDPSVDYIKRVIGLPGDRVVLEDGKVYVNGVEQTEPYVQVPDTLADLSVEVLPAHYFVLGDNRRRSCDSREFGQVPCDYVRGKVEVRVWPPERLGRIDA